VLEAMRARRRQPGILSTMTSLWMIRAAVVLVALTAAGTAAAAPGDPATETADRGHRWQLGAFAQVGSGYRAVVPYNSEFCGTAGESVCLGRSPTRLDLGASLGVGRSVELLLEGQFGVERDFGSGSDAVGPRVLAFAPGIDLRVGELGAGHVYASIQVVIDASQFPQADVVDFAFRNEERVQFDVNDDLGLYVFFADVLGARRWLRFELEGGVGIYSRFL
jgi:hypothetical protein